jgi:hypothetical protein
MLSSGTTLKHFSGLLGRCDVTYLTASFNVVTNFKQLVVSPVARFIIIIFISILMCYGKYTTASLKLFSFHYRIHVILLSHTLKV